jgi:ATP-dependent helicase HrpB
MSTFGDRMVREQRLEEGPNGLRVKEVVSLGALVVSDRQIARPDPRLIAAWLADEIQREGVGILPWGELSKALRARVAFLRERDPSWPDLADAALAARLDDWLTDLLSSRFSLAAIPDAALAEALLGLIPREQARRLETLAPARWTAPTGSTHPIDYAAAGGPRVDVRVQELYGLNAHPAVSGAPLTLALLSPAHRPIQLTRDLPGFWRGSWADVRKEMRGRYPKHLWPDNPAEAAPTTRAKPRP